MNHRKLSDSEKKQIIQQVLGAEYHSVGNHFPVFSKVADRLGDFNNIVSFAELVPTLSTYLSGGSTAAVLSGASFAGILLFPVQQIIGLVNANEIGFQMYSYRAIAYAITSWAFDRPMLSGSQRILANQRSNSGSVVFSHEAKAKYHIVWSQTSTKVVNQLNVLCQQKNISKVHLQIIFKALGDGRPGQLSKLILEGFEKEFGHTTKHIWKSLYSVLYPQ